MYIHQALHHLTNTGLNIPFAQIIYAGLYLVHITFACAIYHQAGGIPNLVILLLHLSKRLHSIFILRLFNDCWSVVIMQASILAYQRGRMAIGSVLLRFDCTNRAAFVLILVAVWRCQ